MRKNVYTDVTRWVLHLSQIVDTKQIVRNEVECGLRTRDDLKSVSRSLSLALSRKAI